MLVRRSTPRTGDFGRVPAGDRERRAGLLLLIGALHLAAIWWLARYAVHDPVPPKASETVIAMTSVEAGQAPVQQPKPPARRKVPAKPTPVVVPSVVPSAEQLPSMGEADLGSGAPVAGGGCALAQQAADAIGKDPAAMAELAAFPPGVRTQADAVMLWDGRWTDTSTAQTPFGGAIRRSIEQTVAAALPACRDLAAAGPQFIPVPEGARTTMLVIGSGAWRWSDLLDPAATCVAAGNERCPPANPNQPTAN